MRISVDGSEYELTFMHERYNGDGYIGTQKAPIKAATYCGVYKDGRFVIAAGSFCSNVDNFDRRVGRKQAMSRALVAAKIPKETRKKIWDAVRPTWKGEDVYVKATVPG